MKSTLLATFLLQSALHEVGPSSTSSNDSGDKKIVRHLHFRTRYTRNVSCNFCRSKIARQVAVTEIAKCNSTGFIKQRHDFLPADVEERVAKMRISDV